MNAIRNKTLTGGNNARRIPFLSSPGKTAVGLPKIDPEIYRNASYLMFEDFGHENSYLNPRKAL